MNGSVSGVLLVLLTASGLLGQGEEARREEPGRHETTIGTSTPVLGSSPVAGGVATGMDGADGTAGGGNSPPLSQRGFRSQGGAKTASPTRFGVAGAFSPATPAEATPTLARLHSTGGQDGVEPKTPRPDECNR